MQGVWRGRSPRCGPACLRGRDGDWGWSRGRKERVPPGEAETLWCAQNRWVRQIPQIQAQAGALEIKENRSCCKDGCKIARQLFLSFF